MRSRTLLSLLLAACGGSTPPPATQPGPATQPAASASAAKAPAATAPAAPTTLRLPRTVKPVRYQIELHVDPAAERAAGTADVDVEILEATDTIWLNGDGLKIEAATVAPAGGAAARADAFVIPKDHVAVVMPQALRPGAARIHFEYSAAIHSGDQSGWGIYSMKRDDASYVWTQFESTAARSAFPCFDEPDYKTPWQITLHIKNEQFAFSNTPAVTDKDEGNGWKTVAFAETKPLPSYLVAFAVGPFDVIEAGKGGKNGTPMRIIVPRGAAEKAQVAARLAPELLGALEDYYGVPYPYEKLDNVANLGGGGAMENAGIIITAQRALLSDGSKAGERRIRIVMAHEMAHHWTGDLVTTTWWDDIWLNEGFATWMELKIGNPEDEEKERVRNLRRAMAADARPDARRIREPIVQFRDIERAFDAITYSKGGLVLAMFEHYIGAAKFKAAVHDYLTTHAHGNATTADFEAALSAAGGPQIGPAFGSFVDQQGIPAVSVKLTCAKKSAKLTFSQRPYHRAGTPKDEEQRVWTIPVCWKMGWGSEAGGSCLLLGATPEEAEVGGKGCPDYAEANKDAAGYYHTIYEPALYAKLLGRYTQLTAAERLYAVADGNLLVRDGVVGADEVLPAVAKLAASPDGDLVAEIVTGLAEIDAAQLISDELRPRWARFVSATLGKRAHAVGWLPRPGEKDDLRQLRGPLLSLVAIQGEDKALADEARKLAEKWLDDRKAIDPDLRDDVFKVASWYGDKAFFDRLSGVLEKLEPSSPDRFLLLQALAGFRDPELSKAAVARLFQQQGGAQLRRAAFLGAAVRQPAVWQYVKEHFDELAARMPQRRRGGVMFATRGLCDAASREDVKTVLEPKLAKIEGGKEDLAQALESIDLCIAAREAAAPGLKKLLK